MQHDKKVIELGIELRRLGKFAEVVFADARVAISSKSSMALSHPDLGQCRYTENKKIRARDLSDFGI